MSEKCKTCQHYKPGFQATGFCHEPGKIVYAGKDPVTKPPAVSPHHHCANHKVKA